MGILSYIGLFRDNENENGNYRDSSGHIRIIYRVYIGGNIGIMEKKMETTITGYIGFKGLRFKGLGFRV